MSDGDVLQSVIANVAEFRRRERGGSAADGAAILGQAHDFLRRFVAFPSVEAATVAALWAAHTHFIDRLDSTPRLCAVSPEPGCGKSRLLEVLELLTRTPLAVLNASPAPIFREVHHGAEDGHPVTLLFDESDVLFRPSRGDDPNADLRALLNAGHRRGAVIPRCVGTKHEVVRFEVFAAAALAGIGNPPPTLASRSVILRMRRRAPDEHVEAFRYRRHSREGAAIRDRLEAWAEEAGEAVERAEPILPAGVTDRPADVWEPLLAVADAAGGDWPAAARAACVLFTSSTNEDEQTLGMLLLRDLRAVFGGARAMSSKQILEALVQLDESPWSDMHGRALDQRRLARMLRPYGVRSKQVKLDDGRSLKGYHAEELGDAFRRYLPEEGKPAKPAKPVNAHGQSEVSEVSEVSHIRPEAGRTCPVCQRLGAPCGLHYEGPA